METDTKPENDKVCSKCSETKTNDKFIKNRNICKECRNARSRQNYNATVIDSEDIATSPKECKTCNETKYLSDFVKETNVCKDCNNLKRRNKYHNDEESRLKIINAASVFKHNKVLERQQIKLEEIGEDNKKCSVCFTIKNIISKLENDKLDRPGLPNINSLLISYQFLIAGLLTTYESLINLTLVHYYFFISPSSVPY